MNALFTGSGVNLGCRWSWEFWLMQAHCGNMGMMWVKWMVCVGDGVL